MRLTSSSVKAAASGVMLFRAFSRHDSQSVAIFFRRLSRNLCSSSISVGEITNAAVRPCRVIATGSRCAVSSSCPKLFWASAEVFVIIAGPSRIAIIAKIANRRPSRVPASRKILHRKHLNQFRIRNILFSPVLVIEAVMEIGEDPAPARLLHFGDHVPRRERRAALISGNSHLPDRVFPARIRPAQKRVELHPGDPAWKPRRTLQQPEQIGRQHRRLHLHHIGGRMSLMKPRLISLVRLGVPIPVVKLLHKRPAGLLLAILALCNRPARCTNQTGQQQTGAPNPGRRSAVANPSPSHLHRLRAGHHQPALFTRTTVIFENPSSNTGGFSFSAILRITSSLTMRSRERLRSRQTSRGTSKNTACTSYPKLFDILIHWRRSWMERLVAST